MVNGMKLNSVIILILLTCAGIGFGDDWADNEIADAIYKAEGGKNACVPYGILSVKVRNEIEARQICLNTIRNNRKRYMDYGYKQYPDFISFLGNRYCPVNCENDNGTNKFWIRNVKFYLDKIH